MVLGANKNFVINVEYGPAYKDSGEEICGTTPLCNTDNAAMLYPESSFLVGVNKDEKKNIAIVPAGGTAKGTYAFNVYVCYDVVSGFSDECVPGIEANAGMLYDFKKIYVRAK